MTVSQDHAQPITAVTSGQTHTPGPWEWDCGLTPPDGPQRYADIYKDGGDLIIAQFNNLIPEGRANAHLIAAAPDLLEALKAAVEVIKKGGSGFDTFEEWEAAEQLVILKGRAAISKAEGQS